MAIVVRELVTKLGYSSDTSQLSKYNNIAKAAIGVTVGVTAALAAMTAGFLKTAGDIEQTEIAFETILKSQEAADKLMGDLKEFAKTTPFELKELIRYTQGLLGAKVAAEDITDTLNVLGNIAAGVGKERLPSIVLAFRKIRNKGKATMEELNIFLEAGVPILDQLATNYGLTTAEIQKMVSLGKIGVADIDKALRDLGTGSGMFANLMDEQSKSFLGIISNIQDALFQIALGIGKELLPIGKDFALVVKDWLDAAAPFIQSGLVGVIKSIADWVVILVHFGKELIDGMGGADKVFKKLQERLKPLQPLFKRLETAVIKVMAIWTDLMNELGISQGSFDLLLFLIDAMVFQLEGLVMIIEFLVDTYALFAKGLKEVGKWLSPVIEDIGNFFNEFTKSEQVTEGMNSINKIIVVTAMLIQRTWSAISTFFSDTMNRIKTTITTVWNTVSAFLSDTWNTIVKLAETQINNIVEFWTGGFSLIQTKIEEVFHNVVKFFEGIFKEIEPILNTIMEAGKIAFEFTPMGAITNAASDAATNNTNTTNNNSNTTNNNNNTINNNITINSRAENAEELANELLRQGLTGIPGTER